MMMTDPIRYKLPFSLQQSNGKFMFWEAQNSAVGGNLPCGAATDVGRSGHPVGLGRKSQSRKNTSMNNDKKGGRPQKNVAEKLSYKITVKLCTQDYYSLKARAKTAGMRLAEFARMTILDGQIRPRLTPEEAG